MSSLPDSHDGNPPDGPEPSPLDPAPAAPGGELFPWEIPAIEPKAPQEMPLDEPLPHPVGAVPPADEASSPLPWDGEFGAEPEPDPGLMPWEAVVGPAAPAAPPPLPTATAPPVPRSPYDTAPFAVPFPHPSAPPAEPAPAATLRGPLPVLPEAREPAKAPAPAPKAAVPIPMVSSRRGRPLLLIAAVLGLILLGGAGLRAYLRRPLVVDVLSMPTGAAVFLDGRLVGHTPCMDLRIPGRAGTLRIQSPSYQPHTHVLSTKDRTLDFTLLREPHRIAVSTEPEGVEVLLNGQVVGRTPMADLAVPREGRQELCLRLKGYQEWRHEVDPDLPFPALIRLTPE